MSGLPGPALIEPVGNAIGSLNERLVLVVDDDADIREALTDTLEDEGFQVATAENGAAALAYLRRYTRPALVLLDWMMPVMDGAQFHCELSADARFADLPVVLLTADANAKGKALSLGIRGFLKKPVNVQDLLDEVERYARRGAR